MLRQAFVRNKMRHCGCDRQLQKQSCYQIIDAAFIPVITYVLHYTIFLFEVTEVLRNDRVLNVVIGLTLNVSM